MQTAAGIGELSLTLQEGEWGKQFSLCVSLLRAFVDFVIANEGLGSVTAVGHAKQLRARRL
jgi:hypothetical protein